MYRNGLAEKQGTKHGPWSGHKGMWWLRGGGGGLRRSCRPGVRCVGLGRPRSHPMVWSLLRGSLCACCLDVPLRRLGLRRPRFVPVPTLKAAGMSTQFALALQQPRKCNKWPGRHIALASWRPQELLACPWLYAAVRLPVVLLQPGHQLQFSSTRTLAKRPPPREFDSLPWLNKPGCGAALPLGSSCVRQSSDTVLHVAQGPNGRTHRNTVLHL